MSGVSSSIIVESSKTDDFLHDFSVRLPPGEYSLQLQQGKVLLKYTYSEVGTSRTIRTKAVRGIRTLLYF